MSELPHLSAAKHFDDSLLRDSLGNSLGTMSTCSLLSNPQDADKLALMAIQKLERELRGELCCCLCESHLEFHSESFSENFSVGNRLGSIVPVWSLATENDL